jgi:hypothetical protein
VWHSWRINRPVNACNSEFSMKKKKHNVLPRKKVFFYKLTNTREGRKEDSFTSTAELSQNAEGAKESRREAKTRSQKKKRVCLQCAGLPAL